MDSLSAEDSHSHAVGLCADIDCRCDWTTGVAGAGEGGSGVLLTRETTAYVALVGRTFAPLPPQTYDFPLVRSAFTVAGFKVTAIRLGCRPPP